MIMKQSIISKTEDAIDALRSCNLTVAGLVLERQYVVLKDKLCTVQMAFVDSSKVIVSAMKPMEVMELSKSIPCVIEIELSRSHIPAEAFFDVRYCDRFDEVSILTIRFKYGVCPPIANHNFGIVNNHAVKLFGNSLSNCDENVIIDVVCHVNELLEKRDNVFHKSAHHKCERKQHL